MQQLIEYLIKLSGTLTVLYLFYWIVLQRLTFYTSNRWYLLCYSIAAFLIPLIDINPVLEQAELTNDEFIKWVPVVSAGAIENAKPSRSDYDFLAAGNLLFLFLCAGIILMLVRFIIQYLSVRSVRRGSQLISDGEVKVFHTDKNIAPFSFGNSIFINQNIHAENDLDDIIRHEFIHVKQKHTVDILWSEWLCIFNWYNPFAWLIRNAIRQNLEFIADNKVLENGIDRKDYQYLLLKVMGAQQSGIATSFNFTSLKKRIAMMNKTRSAKVHFIKFLFVLPLMALILLAFRNQVSKQELNKDNLSGTISANHLQIDKIVPDTIPSPPHSPAPHVPYVARPNSKGFIITIADNHGECIVIVRNKENKIVKAVSLLEWDENENEYKREYGEIPSPSGSTRVIIDRIPEPAPPTAPPITLMPENVSSIYVKDRKLTLGLKDGKTEIYDLNNPEQKAAFEKKYGPVPVSPQNPKSNPNPRSHPNPPLIIDTKEYRKN